MDVKSQISDEDFASCQTLMTGVGYNELKKVSQATGLLHEWIWVMLQLREVTLRVSDLQAKKKAGL